MTEQTDEQQQDHALSAYIRALQENIKLTRMITRLREQATTPREYESPEHFSQRIDSSTSYFYKMRGLGVFKTIKLGGKTFVHIKDNLQALSENSE